MTALNLVRTRKLCTWEQVREEHEAIARQVAEPACGPRLSHNDLRPFMVGGMAQEIASLRNEKAELMARIENFKLLEVC